MDVNIESLDPVLLIFSFLLISHDLEFAWRPQKLIHKEFLSLPSEQSGVKYSHFSNFFTLIFELINSHNILISLPWHTLPPKYFNFQVDKFGYLASFHILESLIITMLYLLLKSPKSGKIIGVHNSKRAQKGDKKTSKMFTKLLS